MNCWRNFLHSWSTLASQAALYDDFYDDKIFALVSFCGLALILADSLHHVHCAPVPCSFRAGGAFEWKELDSFATWFTQFATESIQIRCG